MYGPLSFWLSCVAFRDVSEEETIYISYTNLHHPPDKRRAALREQYYFDCGCSRCCEGDIQVGDRLREILI